MIKNVYRYTQFGIISLFILIVSCATVKEQNYKSEGARYNFAIGSDNTVFKEKIYLRLIEKYKSQANIDIMDLNKIKNINARNYNAIIIMDTCMAGSPSDAYKPFTEANEKDKLILFVSANSKTWKFNRDGIDAITAASKTENLDNVFMKITDRIDEIISVK